MLGVRVRGFIVVNLTEKGGKSCADVHIPAVPVAVRSAVAGARLSVAGVSAIGCKVVVR